MKSRWYGRDKYVCYAIVNKYVPVKAEYNHITYPVLPFDFHLTDTIAQIKKLTTTSSVENLEKDEGAEWSISDSRTQHR
jgi:hypothetical protein